MTTLKVNVIKKPTIKVKALVKFPANVVAQKFLTVANSGGTYTFDIDYTLLSPGPITSASTAFIVALDQSDGLYKEVALSSLLTSGLDADLQAIAALSTTGILVRTAANTWALRTDTGTANEITVTNGNGVSGNPTFSLPSALTFTGKTITNGTYTTPTISAITTTTPLLIANGAAAQGINVGSIGVGPVYATFSGLTNTGQIGVGGSSSGLTILQSLAAASGTLTLPSATDTLIGKATTDILTNKTYDTAGAGNSFSINSLAATANTGTGAVVRATSPALVTPALGTPTALVLTSATGLPLSGLNTQAAFTFVGNNTSGAAAPTAVDIHTLTLKASPAATDEVIISDQAASGAWKRSPVSSLASASGVSSIAGNTGAFTLANGITNSTNSIELTAARRTLPTTQVFTTGSGTYTTPANCLWIEVEMVGGGGGGAGSGTGPGAAGDGADTTFSTFTAAKGIKAVASVGGAGGASTNGFVNKTGASGGNGSGVNATPGGAGAASPYGGGGSPGAAGAGAGVAAPANTGSGGGGAGVNTTVNGGGGGGAGGFLRGIINSPGATFSYGVGAGGTAGTAGTGGAAGGAGGSGFIQVTEHYGT